MKILLAVPTARFIDVECFESIYNMTKKGKIDLFIPNSYSIDVSRLVISKYAQENKYDYVMWVDSDCIVPKNALVKLLEADKDIIAGVYRHKILGSQTVVAKRFTNSKKETYMDLLRSDMKNGVIEVDAFGFGCCLMKVSVLEKIEFPWFVYTTDMGEDVYFCRKAQNAGYKLYLHTDILCGHKGEVNYDV